MEHTRIAPSAPPTNDEARDLVRHASELEDIIRDAGALLTAIDHAALFEGSRDDEDARERLQVGFSLLDIARRRLTEAERIPGTDLSIKLSCLAREARS